MYTLVLCVRPGFSHWNSAEKESNKNIDLKKGNGAFNLGTPRTLRPGN